MTIEQLSTKPPQAPQTPYNKSMKKQPTKLDMSAIMADYTAKVNAEAKRREEIRQQILAGTYVPVPETRWNISDRD